MNKVIDINDVLTYPEEICHLFRNNESFDPNILLGKYDFKCCHVCCTLDINNYYKFGIMRPFRVFNDNCVEVNTILKDLILSPISNYVDYKQYADNYDKLLYKEYEDNKDLVDDWYGKYSCVCYTMDNLSKINVSNPCYEPIINCYGGELFRDLGFSDKQAEEIAKDYKSYVIFFRLSYDEINKRIYIGNLIEHMRLMYTTGKSHYGFEGSINKDISPNDFIDVKELKKYE